jgi:hypothetical protein
VTYNVDIKTDIIDQISSLDNSLTSYLEIVLESEETNLE